MVTGETCFIEENRLGRINHNSPFLRRIESHTF